MSPAYLLSNVPTVLKVYVFSFEDYPNVDRATHIVLWEVIGVSDLRKSD